MSNPQHPNQQAPSGVPVGILIAIAVLAIAGVAMLIYAILLGRSTLASDPADGTATQLALQPASPISIPTVTPGATATAVLLPTDTPLPTETLAAAAETPAPSGLTVNITLPANVRGGPGTNYPILAGMAVGSTPAVIGRDSAAQWYVISDASIPGGQGWVSNLVAAFSGDVNSLPVIPAPPLSVPPTATNTSRPADTAAPAATSTPSVYSSRGIVGNAFWVENTTAGVGQDIWFNFKVTNTTNTDVSYSVLAARAESGQSAQSWTNQVLTANAVLEWRDHINMSAAGTYRLFLGICYGGKDACLANSAPWDRLSPSITVTVQ